MIQRVQSEAERWNAKGDELMALSKTVNDTAGIRYATAAVECQLKVGEALQLRDRMRFDLAQYYLGQHRRQEAIDLLRRVAWVEGDPTTHTRIGDEARRQLRSLGE